MAKKGKNRDGQARLDFLYKAANLMIQLHVKERKQQAVDQADSLFVALSQYYTKIMVDVSKKTVIRL